MWITHSRNRRWLSNSWLVADRPGGHAVLIDAGGPVEPLEAAIQAQRLTLTHVLCTHHHTDHVLHNDHWREGHGCRICGHEDEREFFGPLDATLADGEELAIGDLKVRALHVPGHTIGQLAFLVNERALFTGDTLFRGSVGGTLAMAHGTFEELRHSILEVLLALPDETEIYPGHMDPTSVARERETNPFVAAWTGRAEVRPRPCSIFGKPAELLLEAPDYDGGTKAWVRFPGGREDVVPGSRIQPVT